MIGFDYFAKRPDGIRLIIKRHGFVRIFPIRLNPKPFKIISLNSNLLVSVFSTLFSKFFSGNFNIYLSNLFFNIQFDWKPMTIPTWNVWRVEALKLFKFNNDIFQYLINCCSKMNLTICIRRSIVK